MVLPTVPDWLKKRDGGLTAGVGPYTAFVVLGGQPQYRLDVRPAKGEFVCAVTQTNNGKRLDGDAKFPTGAAALAGGLEALRGALGW
jgi:hypothetical protein